MRYNVLFFLYSSADYDWLETIAIREQRSEFIVGGNVEARVFTLLFPSNRSRIACGERYLRSHTEQTPNIPPKMLFFGILSILLLTVSAQTVGSNTCSAIIKHSCDNNVPRNSDNCNAKFGNIDDLQDKVQAYINANIEKSFEFLLMSTYFGNFFENRDGLKGLYRKMSDKSWKEAMEFSKYLAHRGSMTNFTVNPLCKVSDMKYELNELESLAKALEHQKELADKALNLHDKALHSHRLNDENIAAQRVNDAGLAHYIVEHFVEPLTESIRQLAGYTNDLKRMLAADSYPVSVYLFDEYIKSTL